MIARSLVAALAVAAAMPAYAVSPEISETETRDIDFVPAGWKLYDKAEGDLNGDGVSDSVLVIQATDPELVIDNPDGFGVPRYDANQRILLFVISDPEGYLKLAGRDDLVIPDRSSPTIDDPYSDVEIKDGKATLYLNFWASMGSYGTSWHQFHFRWDGAQMAVIGYDGGTVHRASGETRSVSLNYLSNRRKDSTGMIDKDETDDSWSAIPPGSAPEVGKIGDGFEFLPL